MPRVEKVLMKESLILLQINLLFLKKESPPVKKYLIHGRPNQFIFTI